MFEFGVGVGGDFLVWGWVLILLEDEYLNVRISV